MLQEKICRGQDKARSISGCGHLVKVEYRKYGLCPSCFSDFLNTDIGKPLLRSSIKRGQQKIQAEAETSLKTQKKALREATTNWKKKLQDEVQLIARLIDAQLPCLARGIFGKMAGGHVFSKGGHAQMRFSLHNIHRQCFMSNGKQSDDGLMREKLAEEYGSDYADFVSGLRKYDVPKLKDWEYQQIYYTARKISNRLNKEAKVYSLEERIEKRNEVNLLLGIYTPEQSIFKRL